MKRKRVSENQAAVAALGNNSKILAASERAILSGRDSWTQTMGINSSSPFTCGNASGHGVAAQPRLPSHEELQSTLLGRNSGVSNANCVPRSSSRQG